jgi:hypothetical protein
LEKYLPIGAGNSLAAYPTLPLSGSVGEGPLMSFAGSVTHWLIQLQAGDAAAQLGRVPRTVKRWPQLIRQIGEKELHS